MLLMIFFILINIVRADFIVVGDWGRGGTEAQKQMAGVFKKLDPDFIISSGVPSNIIFPPFSPPSGPRSIARGRVYWL